MSDGRRRRSVRLLSMRRAESSQKCCQTWRAERVEKEPLPASGAQGVEAPQQGPSRRCCGEGSRAAARAARGQEAPALWATGGPCDRDGCPQAVGHSVSSFTPCCSWAAIHLKVRATGQGVQNVNFDQRLEVLQCHIACISEKRSPSMPRSIPGVAAGVRWRLWTWRRTCPRTRPAPPTRTTTRTTWTASWSGSSLTMPASLPTLPSRNGTEVRYR